MLGRLIAVLGLCVSVALTLASGAMTAGKTVVLFLTGAAIDLARKNGIDHTHVKPMEPLKDLLTALMERGGGVLVCPPCTTARGYAQDCMIDGVVISGASVLFERIKNDAATLTF